MSHWDLLEIRPNVSPGSPVGDWFSLKLVSDPACGPARWPTLKSGSDSIALWRNEVTLGLCSDKTKGWVWVPWM